jgi:hypothetical protein
MVELCNSVESKTRRIAETCDHLDRAWLSSGKTGFDMRSRTRTRTMAAKARRSHAR